MTARALGVSFAPRAGLQEHARASAEWLAAADYQAAIEGLFSRPGEVVFGEESGDQAHARFAAAVYELLQEHPADNVIVFAHGTVMTLFVSRAAAGIEPIAFWRQLGMPAVVVMSRPGLELEKVIAEVRTDGA